MNLTLRRIARRALLAGAASVTAGLALQASVFAACNGNTFAPCGGIGCSPDNTAPFPFSHCCQQVTDSGGSGCCTYTMGTLFYCKHADGTFCKCDNGIQYISGVCTNAVGPDHNKTCNTDACSGKGGQCL